MNTQELVDNLNKNVKSNVREYSLVINGNNRFSLSNETDRDVMTDYFPGIWGISSQKSAMMLARQIQADGDVIIRVTVYNPKHHALANKFIKELNINQLPFEEVAPLPVSNVTNGMPSNLSQLKKYLQVGTKIRIVSAIRPENTRDTEVIKTQTNAVVTRKGENGKSWIEFGKASDWVFDNTGATYYEIRRDGTFQVFKIEYINR